MTHPQIAERLNEAIYDLEDPGKRLAVVAALKVLRDEVGATLNVFYGDHSGSFAVPTFRELRAGDIPPLDASAIGSGSKYITAIVDGVFHQWPVKIDACTGERMIDDFKHESMEVGK